jgi:hypothetical protein
MPSTIKPRYFKICPRGFANEVLYIRVTRDADAATLDKDYEYFADDRPGAYAGWTSDARARIPGVAVDFNDRYWVLGLTPADIAAGNL